MFVHIAARRRASTLIVIACAALAFGVTVYFADRRPSDAMLLAAFEGWGRIGVFGAMGQWLPSFVHPFAFSLLTASALGANRLSRYGACAIWCVVNVGFEVGQHAAFKPLWLEALHTNAGDWLITRSTLNYLLHGTFDTGDLCAIVLGALSAALVLHWVDKQWEAHHAPR